MSGDLFDPGYISGRTIQDVFTFRMSQLQYEILPDGTPHRRRIIDFVDALRVELLGKCDRRPEPRQKARPQPPATPAKTESGSGDEIAPDSRDAYNAYVARNRRG